jgi:hypothetical protein
MATPSIQDFAELTIVNAYEPLPRLGATRALPQVAEAMSAAAGRTFDVLRYRDAVERNAAQRLGFDGATAVAGARAGLALAAWLASQRRPSAKIVAVHPTPRTAYSVFVTAHGLVAREINLDNELDDTLLPQLAAALLVLRSNANDLPRVLSTRARCTERGVPLIIDAAAAPWRELAPLCHPGALVVTSASKTQGGPTASGFLLVGEHWRPMIAERISDLRFELLRPGKEALVGLGTLLAASSLPQSRADRMDCQPAPAALRDLGFVALHRQPYWRNKAPGNGTDGTVYARSFSGSEGGAVVADRIATRLWNLEPPVVVGCRANAIHVSVDRLTALEVGYIAAALTVTISWALAESGSCE